VNSSLDGQEDKMSYPPRRPHFEHQNSSTTDLTAGHGPGMPMPMTSGDSIPLSGSGLPYDPERAQSTTSLTGQGNKLRKPAWGKKADSEPGYTELDDSRTSAAYHQNGSEFRLPDGELPKTKACTLNLVQSPHNSHG